MHLLLQPPHCFIFLNRFGGNRTGKPLKCLCYKKCFISTDLTHCVGEGRSGLIQGVTRKIIFQKKNFKIGILGGGSNFSLRTLYVPFASKAVASGYIKVESIS